MLNLAGDERCDSFIYSELLFAGIAITSVAKEHSEVPYTLIGKFGKWTFTRSWYYWVARSEEGYGLLSSIANKLHEKEYMDQGVMKKYGEVIRVTGHCGCPAPKEWLSHYNEEGKKLILDPEEVQKKQYEDMLKRRLISLPNNLLFVKSFDDLNVKSVIDSYHIDTQNGLNEFVRVLNKIEE